MRRGIICICAILITTITASAQTNTFPSSGNVGIGTVSPRDQLSIANTSGNAVIDLTGTGAAVVNYDTSLSGFDSWQVGAGAYAVAGLNFVDTTIPASRMTIANSGNVGIGTTTPGAQLDVEGSGLLEVGQAYLNSSLSAANSWQRFSLGYGAYWNSSTGNYTITDPTYNQSTFSNENGTFVWTTHVGALTGSQSYAQWHANDKMVLTYTGNLGVGTIAPNARLEVNGSIQLTAGSGSTLTFADGTTQTTAWTGALCGGDYAESVGVSGKRIQYEPGDVLVINPVDAQRFLKSSTPYSKTVAGIYSTRPGLVGRRSSDAETLKAQIPMAMTGIVPTKVTAENGPIEVGDLLVTSSVPGHAMKGTDSPRMLGAIVGKALGSLANGNGLIEVLVTLQ